MRHAQAASAVCIRIRSTPLDLLVNPTSLACVPLRPPRLRPARCDLVGRRLRRRGQQRAYEVDHFPVGHDWA
jgi:hypothetical protein